ncbi:1,2-phenylacetyl-CoA epoxidase subunit PaaC [Paenochrobactrum sp. BZR 588]|uniref:1,2-phenylacetyl-CoA epoxidase subunit PaaC n=1 Tax=unclassified Paenochrobactrum TaxID=2639760 RepID=UPI0038538A32
MSAAHGKTAPVRDRARQEEIVRNVRPLAEPKNDPLFETLLRIGDNTLILGHRVSEWCGHSPALEEDIALANVALDLIGQTQLWLGLAGEVEGKGRSADDLAFLRDGWDFKNLLIVERPNGDYGHTLMRQFLFDAYHLELLKELKKSTDQRIADIAEKSAKEVAYHLERSSDLVIRLGDGTATSHTIMQNALDALWSYTGEMFISDDSDKQVAEQGLAPDPADLRANWEAVIHAVLSEGNLRVPDGNFAHQGGRQGVHTEHLGHLLTQMQWLQRAYPGASW